MKITESNLQKMINLALTTPDTLKDYCYYDGCPTNWSRGMLDHKKNGEYLVYRCDECHTKRHYNLTKLREMGREEKK